MKAPVYLESTLELLAVVEVSPHEEQTLREQRFINMCEYRPLRSMSQYPDQVDTITSDFSYITFKRVGLHNSFAATFALVVQKREHVNAWPRRVWPRQKKKDRYKPSRAERKDRRQYMEQHPQAMTRDQAHDPLYRKLVHKTQRA